jgi:AGZA family xanthine/uracil permease-like MFS transporter
MGAGIGYTVATGLSMLILSLFGIGAFLLAVIPIYAIAPILVYIGVVTANQVVRETPKLEVPVIFIALFPWIANWALTLANNVLGAAGTAAGTVGIDKLASKGVYYEGLSHLGNGAPIASLLWGCIAIFAINDKPLRGAAAAAVAAVLSIVGFIHSPTVAFAKGASVEFFFGYLMIAAIFVIKFMMDRSKSQPKPESGKNAA